MRNMSIAFGLTLLLVAWSGSASASTPQGRFAIEDAGRFSCAEVVKAKQATPAMYARLLGFVEGYVTAANRYEPNTYDLAPWHNLATYSIIVSSHCERNAKDSLVMAAQRLVEALKPQRLTDFSEVLVIQEGGKPVPVYKSVLQRAQVELNKKGFYKGPSNGNFTPELKTAFQTFQQSVKLPVDGIPNPPTLWLLLNP